MLGSPGFFVEFSKQHALSDDGHCRAYSAQASGTVWAEGAAIFVLQRKSAALRDGRQILAEVLGSAVNHDGRSAGLSAPSGAAQVRLFRRAIAEAGIRPDEVGMVEGHGTGTRLGDRTELQSLAQTYGDTEPDSGALLGSVKSNLGHALAASGGAGAGQDPGRRRTRRHTADPARRRGEPRDRLGKTGFAPRDKADAVARGRRAAGSGHFGVRDRRHQRARHRLPSRGRVMLAQPLPDGRVPVLLSAHDEKLIGQDARAILDYLDRLDAEHDPTVDVASTLLRLRRVRRHRAVVRAADRAELVAGLSALARGEEHPLVARSSKSVAPCVAFVFPGQGNQWQSMGADAYRRLPAYRAEADRCAEAFVAAGLPSPLPYLQGDQERSWSRTEIQGAQFIHAVSLAAQWRFCGVLPAITIGHSLGEVAAAYVAEKISLSDAVALVGARAAVVDRLTGHYAMAVLGVGLDEAEALIGETPGWLEISAVNGPSSTVVSGDHDAVVAVAAAGSAARRVHPPTDRGLPGPHQRAAAVGRRTGELLPSSAFRDGPMAFIGSAVGAEVGSDVDFSQYWYESLCSTVRFDQAVVAAQKCGADTFVEMSAHPSLLYPLAELVDDDSAVIVGSGHRDGPITDVLSANIAAVAIADPGYPWADALPASLDRRCADSRMRRCGPCTSGPHRNR